ncbi:MAG: helix-turn-helix domain-containing protein [Pirellulales bacterium]
MTTLATVLKDEIRRLARKEIKIQTGKTTKAVAQYRRQIAALKRQIREQQRRLEQLQKLGQKRATEPEQAADANNAMRFSARSVRAQRRRVGLSAADYATLVGVSPLTIYNWEHGKSRPRNGQFETLVSLRGIGKREALARLAAAGAAAAKSGRRGRRPK